MADQKLTALSSFTPVLGDILYGVDDPGGTPASGKVEITALRDLIEGNLTGLTVAGGTVTSNSPLFNGTQEWNEAGTTFVGIGLDVTDTASAADSSLLRLRVGGTDAFNLDKAGNITRNTGGNIILWSNFQSNGNGTASIFGSRCGVQGELAADSGKMSLAVNVFLFSGGSNILEQRNGTNPQTFNIYNTFTDASNYERGGFKWNSNVLEIFSEAAGTGVLRGINFGLSGNSIGFYGATPIAQPSSTGETAGFTAGSGTSVNDDSTFTGNVGSTAYTIGDVVKHMKNLGLIAA